MDGKYFFLMTVLELVLYHIPLVNKDILGCHGNMICIGGRCKAKTRRYQYYQVC